MVRRRLDREVDVVSSVVRVGGSTVIGVVVLLAAAPVGSQVPDDPISVAVSARCAEVLPDVYQWEVAYEARNDLPDDPEAEVPGASDMSLSGTISVAGGSGPVSFEPGVVAPGETGRGQATYLAMVDGPLTLQVDWFVAGQDRSGQAIASTTLGSCPPPGEGDPTRPSLDDLAPAVPSPADAVRVAVPTFTG